MSSKTGNHGSSATLVVAATAAIVGALAGSALTTFFLCHVQNHPRRTVEPDTSNPETQPKTRQANKDKDDDGDAMHDAATKSLVRKHEKQEDCRPNDCRQIDAPPPPPPQQQQQASDTNCPTKPHTSSVSPAPPRRSLVLQEIGTVVSPFPLRAGTPRQGNVAPHVRSQIVLHPATATNVADLVDGLEDYSHIWILFEFHLHPRVGKGQPSSSPSVVRSSSTKVKPPRAGGKKVGALATRSPHRPNPLGMSVVPLDRIERSKSSRGSSRVILHVGGLDVVHGTPVHDMKPYVPWDDISGSRLQFPSWVTSTDDVMAAVHWTLQARQVVCQVQEEGALAPLYPPTNDDDDDDALSLLHAIEEIVAQDPRGLYHGRGKPSSSSCKTATATWTRSKDHVFEITFASLRIGFTVQEHHHDTSRVRQEAWIVHAALDQGDATASPGTYPYHLALRRRAETQHGKPLPWAHPLQEGQVWQHPNDLYRLQNGTVWQGAGKLI